MLLLSAEWPVVRDGGATIGARYSTLGDLLLLLELFLPAERPVVRDSGSTIRTRYGILGVLLPFLLGVDLVALGAAPVPLGALVQRLQFCTLGGRMGLAAEVVVLAIIVLALKRAIASVALIFSPLFTSSVPVIISQRIFS
jgi:hypothetical protein